MQRSGRFWVIILAAGDGHRVRALTTPVPKQFCAIGGQRSMLRWTVDRARRLVPRQRVLVVVAEQHRAFWQRELADLPRRNVVVQPANRGTAAGVLLPFTEVLRRDPAARVLVLPSDQYVRDEERLSEMLVLAAQLVQMRDERVVLLGMRPQRFVSDYGWIVPAAPIGAGPAHEVALLADHPDDHVARQLMRRGALLDSLMFVANAVTLLRLFESTAAEMTDQFLRLDDEGPDYEHALRALYHVLPELDFRGEILPRASDRLAVLPVAACGWTDLATPARLKIFRSRDHLHPASPAGPPGSWFG